MQYRLRCRTCEEMFEGEIKRGESFDYAVCPHCGAICEELPYDYARLPDITVGKEVYLVPYGNYARRGGGGFNAVVTDVKRKYFYIETPGRKLRFTVANAEYDERDGENGGYRVWASKEAYDRFVQSKQKLDSIKEAMRNYRLVLTREDIDAIYEVLERSCILP